MIHERKKILIVDDDPAMQDAFRLIFARAGYDTIVLESADDLLDGTAEVPDIYILDKQLSGVDGLDVCHVLKQQQHTAHIPIIVVSATPHIKQLAKEVGADEFLEKPFPKRELLELVARHLSA